LQGHVLPSFKHSYFSFLKSSFPYSWKMKVRKELENYKSGKNFKYKKKGPWKKKGTLKNRTRSFKK
jgi:hypothetical protein